MRLQPEAAGYCAAMSVSATGPLSAGDDLPVPRSIRGALLPEEAGDFDREFRGAMARATETLDLTGVLQLLEQALAICQALGNQLAEANVLHELGRARHRTGDYPAAAGLLERSVALFREVGDRQGEAEALNATGELLAESAGPREALAAYRQALQLARQVRSPLDEARALEGAARCAARAGDQAAARASLSEAITIYRRIGAAEAGPATEFLASLDIEAWDAAQETIGS